MANNSPVDTPPTVLDSLPNTTLADTAIQTLQQHDEIDECIPIYKLTADGQTIAVLLKHNETTIIAVFNPDTEQWETVFQTETFSNVYGDAATAARDTFTEELKRVYELYDKDDVTLLDPSINNTVALQENAFTNLLTGLPDSPLTKETLVKVKNETEVIEVVPHLYLRDTQNTVFLSITFDDIVKQERRFGLAFFDKDAQEWVGAFMMPASRLDDPTDTEFEDAFNTAFDVVKEAYGSHVLGVVETKADYRDWIPGTPVQDHPDSNP